MIPDYDADTFTHCGMTYELYTRGKGKGVVVMHELPGLTTACVALGNRLVKAGYRVYMPLLFGEANITPNDKTTRRNLFHVCIKKEFRCFAKKKTSPVVEWLKAICWKAHRECGGPGVGAIGMCLTGNFAISLMVDDSMIAPVSCQPSLPFILKSKNRARALGMSPADLEAAKAQAKKGKDLLCFHFTNDDLCPPARYERIKEEFGDALKGMPITSPDEAHDIPEDAHSVLTGHFMDRENHPTREAMNQVLSFFEQKLRP